MNVQVTVEIDADFEDELRAIARVLQNPETVDHKEALEAIDFLKDRAAMMENIDPRKIHSTAISTYNSWFPHRALRR